MSDPLDALNLPITPLAPDPAFAARLRDQIAHALAEGTDQGGPMTDAATTPVATPLATDRSALTGRSTISAYLAVADARAALAWYVDVFGGVAGPTVEMPDGRLGHAEVRIGGSLLMLADEFPELDLLAPPARGGTTVSIVLDVDDVDRSAARAADAGASIERAPEDMPFGFRAAGVIDPFGHRWIVQGPLSTDVAPAVAEPASEVPETGPGDIVYVTWRVKDEQRTAAFFGELLGWTFTPGHVEHGLQVHGSNVLGGLWGGGDHVQTDAKLMYQVADMTTAIATIRALGGTATEPELQPYGWSSECTDDQGMEFWITAPAEA